MGYVFITRYFYNNFEISLCENSNNNKQINDIFELDDFDWIEKNILISPY